MTPEEENGLGCVKLSCIQVEKTDCYSKTSAWMLAWFHEMPLLKKKTHL